MPEAVISLSTPPPGAAAGRPPAANESEAPEGGVPFSDVLAQKLDQVSPHSNKPAKSDLEKKDAATTADIATGTAPAGQILPPDGNTPQLALNVSQPATAATLTPPGQQDGDAAGATASFSSVAALNGTGTAQLLKLGNGKSNLEGQDGPQITASGQLLPGQSQRQGQTPDGAHPDTGVTNGLSADPTQLSAANAFSIGNAQHLSNENTAAAKSSQGEVQALAGLAAQPDTATANAAPGSVSNPSGLNGLQHNPPAPLVSTPIPLPVNHPDWDQALGQRVVWLVKQDVQGAELRINPPQLGPVEMRIVLNNGQADVAFTSQHAVVRDALEAAMPRLREMFSDNGLNLVNVNISQHSFAQQRQDNPYTPLPSSPFNYGDGSQPLEGSASNTLVRVLAGLVDFYA